MHTVITQKGANGHAPPTPRVNRSNSPDGTRRARQGSILFLDPRPLTRECFSRWLAASTRSFRILPLSDPADVSHDEALSEEADLILFNIAGADVTDDRVAETIALLRRILPDVPIALLSDREEMEHVMGAVRHGVRGYIPTTLPVAAAIEALRFVRAGGTFVPTSALMQPVQPQREGGDGAAPNGGGGSSSGDGAAGVGGFTSRELEVLNRLCEGKPNKIIAHELDIRDSTVKVHVRNIMKKLKATNRTQVACLARQLFDHRDSGLGAGDGTPPRG